MRPRRRLRTVTFLIIIMICGVAMGQTPERRSTTFSVELKSNAYEQYAYASRLFGEGQRAGMPREDALFREIAALELVPQRWPQEREVCVQAYALAVQMLSGPTYAVNAVQMAEKAERYGIDDAPQLPFILADKAVALSWLGQYDVAEETFLRAFHSKQFTKDVEPRFQRALWIDLAFMYKRQKRHRDAAAILRHCATLQGSHSFDKADDLSGSIDSDLAAGDLTAANADFDALLLEASTLRTKKINPAEVSRLPYLDQAIADYRKKLKR